MEAAAVAAVAAAVVLNTKDSGTFHDRRKKGQGSSNGVTKSSPEKNIEIVVNHQCHIIIYSVPKYIQSSKESSL